MSRSHTVPRCEACGLHVPLCLCASISPLITRARVLVVMHRKEALKSSNTGRLIPLLMPNSEVRERGHKHQPLSTEGLVDPERRVVLLYPAEDAEVLDAAWCAADPRPVTLVVPDGNWKQASKVVSREPGFRGLPRVTLAPGGPSNYRLRSHPDPARICTLEAVARALGVIEGPEAQAQLEHLLTVFVERTLWTRGTLAEASVTGGIPDKRW